MHWLGLLLLVAPQSSDEGSRLYLAGRYAEAAAAYRSEIQGDPALAEAWAGLGRSLLRLGRPSESLLYLSRAQQLKPADVEIQVTFARALIDTGNIGRAAAFLESLEEKDPRNTELRCLLGECMYRGGYYARTVQLLDPTVIGQPRDPHIASMYTVALAKIGRTAEAEIACKRLLSPPIAPLDLDLVLTYVELLDARSQVQQAIVYADMAVKDQPLNPMTHFWKARLLWHAGRITDAAKEAEQSVSISPDLPFARNLLLQIYRKEGRLEDAHREADWLRAYSDRMAARGR